MKRTSELTMKRTSKITITIIIAVIVIAVIGVGAVFINLNKKKKSITAADFKSSMEQKGYNIIDANSQFSEYDYVKQAYIAASSDYSFQIEFYELADENYAIGFYNNNKSRFESQKGKIFAETSVSLKNYSKYTLSTDNKYKVVSRIDNTVIYVDVDDDYKKTVKAILDKLGY